MITVVVTSYALDNTWSALLQPGRAEMFFRGPRQYEMRCDEYCPHTCFFLAELSRLIYLQEADEIGDATGERTRADHLRATGAEEIRFFSAGGTQAFLVRLPSTGPTSTHALVFRGTHDVRDWLSNLNVAPSSWPGAGTVHRGFVTALDQLWAEISAALESCAGSGDTILFAGHSLGGALATLAAARRSPAALYTFGSPRVGDAAFNAHLATTPVHRVVNNLDVVASVPPSGPALRFEHPGCHHLLTMDGHRLINPPDDAGERGLIANLSQLLDDALHRPVQHPPTALADHAPINYVTRLSELALAEG